MNTNSAKQIRDVTLWAILLFGLTLAGALPLLIGGWGLDALPDGSVWLPLVMVGIVLIGWTPSLAALIVVWLRDGIGNLLLWLRRVTRPRVAAGWFALVLVAPLGLVLLALWVTVLLGGATPERWLALPDGPGFLGALIAGSLGEELGWRAFAGPRLQSRYGFLTASTIIGLLWGAWHLWPAITASGAADLAAANVAQTLIRMVATAIIYGWLFNRSGGSLWLVMAAHAGHNLAIELVQIPAAGGETAGLIIALLYAVVAALVVILRRREHERDRVEQPAE